MVRTRQHAKTDPTPTRGRGSNLHDDSSTERNSVADTASHIPTILVHSEGEESTGGQENSTSRRTDVPAAEASEGERQAQISPPAAPGVAPNLFSDPAFMEHIVRAVAAGMTAGISNVAPRSERVVTIVQWVKDMREMGCGTFSGVEDAEVAGHWMRKIERVIEQMHIPEETKVDCVSQLLTESAHSWWETVRGRRVGEVLRWREFREEFEERYYSWEHRREKEQEFLELRQGDMTVLEYEKRFQDLTPFASTYLPTERHRVDRFRDGLRQELRMIVMAMQFQSVRDLVRAAQGIERVMRDTAKPVIEQGQTTGFKRRDSGFSSGRPPFQKKGKNAQMSGQFQKRGGSFNQGSSSGGFRQTDRTGSWGGQVRQGAMTTGGSTEQRGLVYPLCQRCEQRHPGDCSTMPGRCYICRGEGHRWRDCQYLGRGCFLCGEMGHRKKECPHRVTGGVQGRGMATQSQQQSVTVDRPVRPTQSGASAHKGRPRLSEERTRGRIYHMTQEDVGAMPDVVAGGAVGIEPSSRPEPPRSRAGSSHSRQE